MKDYRDVRDVVGDIEGRHISLEERGRLCESEEIIHLCKAHKELQYAAGDKDNPDVWSLLDGVESTIVSRLEAKDWEDTEDDNE